MLTLALISFKDIIFKEPINHKELELFMVMLHLSDAPFWSRILGSLT